MSKQQHYSLQAFLGYIAKYRLRVGIVFGCFVIANVSLAIIPLFIGKLVGALTATHIIRSQVYTYVWLLMACSFTHSVTWRLSEYLYLKLLKPMTFRFENIVFNQVVQKPYPYFVDKFTGKISSYINTLGEEMRNFVDDIFYNYTGEFIRLIAVAIILIAVNWQTGSIFIGGLLLMVLVGRKTVRNSIKYEKQFADVQSTKNGRIVDAIANFVNIKSFQKELLETKGIAVEQEKTVETGNKAFFWGIVFWGSMNTIVREVIWPSTIFLNVYLFLHGQLTVAQLTTFLSAILLFAEFIWEVIWYITRFNIKLARIEEGYTYLFGEANIINEHFAAQKTVESKRSFSQSLVLQNLHFAYPDKKEMSVLSDINLTLSKHEKIGIVGKSGSGKTTLTKLLLGYYPASENQILLDGLNIPTTELSKLIAYVPQDTTLFHRSIADNIAYATNKEGSRAAIVRAAKQAHADEFISQISDGYDALVGERGVKLSAGQRQRIAIARAFLDDQPILILDEATSALDSESEVLVQEALEALWQNKTVIAIAHRLSTLRHMDRIIVMDQGRIVESGSHQQLLKQGGKYAKLWAHQSGGFLEE